MGTACHIRTLATIEGSHDPYDNQNEESSIYITIAGRSNAPNLTTLARPW